MAKQSAVGLLQPTVTFVVMVQMQLLVLIALHRGEVWRRFAAAVGEVRGRGRAFFAHKVARWRALVVVAVHQEFFAGLGGGLTYFLNLDLKVGWQSCLQLLCRVEILLVTYIACT